VSGLTNGATYRCAVTATNDVGTGPPSSPSNAFVPATVPGAPSPVFAVPYPNASAKVIWRAPASGGSAISGYVITPYNGAVAQPARTFNSAKTTEMVTGLQNGKTYQFTVTARNAVGTGAPSAKSAAMTAGAPGQPGQPTAVKVASGSLKVTFAAPNDDGAPITSYTLTCTSSNGGVTKTTTGSASPITISGLTPGKSYSCRVKATNSRGTGPTSSPSAATTA
jgi:hypothetical protein